MNTAQRRGKRQLLLMVIAVSTLSIAIGLGRKKSSSASLIQNLTQPASASQPSRGKKNALIILSILAVLVLLMDFFWLWKVGDIATSAIGATLVGIGGMFQMFADTDAMGLSKRNWRRWIRPLGNICVALGGAALTFTAWQIFLKEYPLPWPTIF